MWLLLALPPQQLSSQMLSLLAWSRRQPQSRQGAALGWGCGRSLAMVRGAAPSSHTGRAPLHFPAAVAEACRTCNF